MSSKSEKKLLRSEPRLNAPAGVTAMSMCAKRLPYQAVTHSLPRKVVDSRTRKCPSMSSPVPFQHHQVSKSLCVVENIKINGVHSTGEHPRRANKIFKEKRNNPGKRVVHGLKDSKA